MSFPRYPEYKESGAAWLGDVPTHWEVQQGRRLYAQKRDAALPDDEQLSATQKYGVVPQRLFMEMADLKVTLALSGLDNFKHVESDDFVISLRSFQGGIERSKYSGCVSPAYTVLRATVAVDAGFMAYVLKSPGYIAALQSVTDGIRDGKNISYEQFGQIGLPYPSQAEQRVIAAFLDRETAKIDALVSEQEKLIDLLKEKRQAVISHAVTKGLDPDVPMKDSGIEWLGEVPAHWEIGALRYFATFGTGSTPDRANENYWNGGIPWVKTGEVNYQTITTTEETITQTALESCSVTLAPPGTLLMALYGQGVTRGRVALLGIHSTYNQACAAIQTDERLNSLFLHAFFVFAYPYIREIGNETTQMNLNIEFVSRIRVVVPPHSEQEEIASFVESETAKLDSLVAEVQHAIELLKERRSALISAAVTGKIDVRGHAAAPVSLETSCV